MKIGHRGVAQPGSAHRSGRVRVHACHEVQIRLPRHFLAKKRLFLRNFAAQE